MNLVLAVAIAISAVSPTGADQSARSASVRQDSVYVPILVYHGVFAHHPGQTPDQIEYDVSPENFDAQMAYLRDSGYRVISLSSYVDAIRTGASVPHKSVVITLDDGAENQYLHAFPILRKYGYTATFFVYPHPIEESHENFMTWAQVRELQSAGMTIGSHTYFHPRLTDIRSEADLKKEIFASRELMEKRLGTTVDLIAYPYGLHNARIDSMVKAAGYRAARGFPVGGWNSGATIFALRAFEITDNMRVFRRDLVASVPPKPGSTQ